MTGKMLDSSSPNWFAIIDWFGPGNDKLELLDCLIDGFLQHIVNEGSNRANCSCALSVNLRVSTRFSKSFDKFLKAAKKLTTLLTRDVFASQES